MPYLDEDEQVFDEKNLSHDLTNIMWDYQRHKRIIPSIDYAKDLQYAQVIATMQLTEAVKELSRLLAKPNANADEAGL